MKKLIILSLFSIFITCGCSNNKVEPEPLVIENTNTEEIFEDNPKVEIKEEDEVEPIEKTETELMYVLAQNGLNIREFADNESSIIDTLPLNTSVLITRDFNIDGWRQIIYNDNKYYVWGEYLSENKVEQKYTYLGNYKITHYCPNPCCGTGNGITVSGVTATPYRTVAMKGIEFGTKLNINENTYVVEDRGVGSGVIDICVNSHQEALNKGVYYADVYVMN